MLGYLKGEINKKKLNEQDHGIITEMMLFESQEDDYMDDVVPEVDSDEGLEKILEGLPEDASGEELEDAEIEEANEEVANPTLDNLVNEGFFL